MNNKKITEEQKKMLYDLLVSLKTIEDYEALFEDLFTAKELEQMVQRVSAAKMLMEGKTYNDVIEQTDISSATLSRVSRCVQYGNGYSRFLK